ncbi:hypothetical protein [Aestuariibacter salexigens]|uniref:hypothetical protein n=1 Tax=Aestuariibacter salexigens TaxID=226010 RepID=UPI00047C684D|nr:hypothetical protein [Aestuariibacter salexigens]
MMRLNFFLIFFFFAGGALSKVPDLRCEFTKYNRWLHLQENNSEWINTRAYLEIVDGKTTDKTGVSSDIERATNSENWYLLNRGPWAAGKLNLVGDSSDLLDLYETELDEIYDAYLVSGGDFMTTMAIGKCFITK